MNKYNCFPPLRHIQGCKPSFLFGSVRGKSRKWKPIKIDLELNSFGTQTVIWSSTKFTFSEGRDLFYFTFSNMILHQFTNLLSSRSIIIMFMSNIVFVLHHQIHHSWYHSQFGQPQKNLLIVFRGQERKVPGRPFLKDGNYPKTCTLSRSNTFTRNSCTEIRLPSLPCHNILYPPIWVLYAKPCNWATKDAQINYKVYLTTPCKWVNFVRNGWQWEFFFLIIQIFSHKFFTVLCKQSVNWSGSELDQEMDYRHQGRQV